MASSNPRVLTRKDQEAPHPVHVVWEVTLACDLACGHCGSRAGDARVSELSTDECRQVISDFADVGVRQITFIGGEAYLRPDFTELVAAATQAGIAAGLTTGGFGLAPKMVKSLADAGLTTASISLDGVGQFHDAQRGRKGAFQAALRAARAVGASSIELGVNTQINRLTAPVLAELAETLVDIGARTWQIQLTVPMGNAVDRPRLLLQPFELAQLFPELARIKQTILDPAHIQLFPGNNVGYFGVHEAELRNGGRGGYWNGCTAGKFVLGLEADGTLKGCPSLATKTHGGGNILTTPLTTLLDSEPLTKLKERTADELWGYCKSCYYADVCMGGCSWMADSLFGRTGNNPYCIHRVEELAKVGQRERVDRTQKAPDLPFATGLFELIREPLQATDDIFRRPDDLTSLQPI